MIRYVTMNISTIFIFCYSSFDAKNPFALRHNKHPKIDVDAISSYE